MIQSLLAYGIMISSMLVFSIKYAELPHTKSIDFRNPLIILIFVIYIVFCGIRYNVGMDYTTYYQQYIECKRYTSYESIENTEPLWNYVTWLLRHNNFHYTIYFGLIAAIQFGFVLGAFKNKSYFLPALILSFFLGGYFINFQNVLRQNLVMAVFLYIVMRRREMNFISFLCVVWVCMYIHKSSFIMILLYPLYRYKISLIKCSRYLVIIYFVCVIIGYRFDLFSKVASSPIFLIQLASSDYAVYASEQYIGLGTSKTMGVGFLLKVLLDSILIWNYRSVHDFYRKDFGYDTYFLFFYLGTCLHYLFPTSMVIGRPILYLTIFTLPVLTYFLYYVRRTMTRKNTFKNALNTIAICILTLLFFANYFVNISGNMTEFHFYWENTSLI